MGSKGNKCCCGWCSGSCINIGSLFPVCPAGCSEFPLNFFVEGFIGSFACCPEAETAAIVLIGDLYNLSCTWLSLPFLCNGVYSQLSLIFSGIGIGEVTVNLYIGGNLVATFYNTMGWKCLCPNVLTRDTSSDITTPTTYTFLVNGSWSPPGPGTVVIKARGTGGGGAGGEPGSGSSNAGDGGGGGSYSESDSIPCGISSTFTHTLGTQGAAGLGDTGDESGGDGGTTTIVSMGVNMVLIGGKGGQGKVGRTTTGAGGTATGGLINISGANGAIHSGNIGGAGGNAANSGGLGGSGGSFGVAGSNGNDFGGGGGGAGKGSVDGGFGGKPMVEYIYTPCSIPSQICINPLQPCCNERTDPIPRTLICDFSDAGNCACASGTFNLPWDSANNWWAGDTYICTAIALNHIYFRVYCSRIVPDGVTTWHIDYRLGESGFFTSATSFTAQCDPIHLAITISLPGACANTLGAVLFDFLEF